MKQVIGALGILILGLTIGYFTYPTLNPPQDQELGFVEAEAKTALIRVTSSWHQDAFRAVSSRRLRALEEAHSVDRFLKAQGATYGTIVNAGKWRLFREPGGYWASCDVEFSRQEARVEMRLIAESGRWRVDDLVLRPKSLGPGEARI
jgi:hypothetical protein